MAENANLTDTQQGISTTSTISTISTTTTTVSTTITQIIGKFRNCLNKSYLRKIIIISLQIPIQFQFCLNWKRSLKCTWVI